MSVDNRIANQWTNWKLITRSYNSLLLAAGFELTKWKMMAQLNIPLDASKTMLVTSLSNGQGRFQLSVQDYCKQLQNHHVLLGGILIHYYSAFESMCVLVIEKYMTDSTKNAKLRERFSDLARDLTDDCEFAEAVVTRKKVEEYAKAMIELSSSGARQVHRVKDVIEVAVVRNAIAHTSGVLTAPMNNRLKDAKISEYREGSKIELDIEIIRRFQKALKGFCRICESKPKKQPELKLAASKSPAKAIKTKSHR